MTDTTTSKLLAISTSRNGRAYAMVPVAMLGEVRALLNAHDVSYWVDEVAVSLDGKPEIIVVNFASRVDPGAVQRLLDSVP